MATKNSVKKSNSAKETKAIQKAANSPTRYTKVVDANTRQVKMVEVNDAATKYSVTPANEYQKRKEEKKKKKKVFLIAIAIFAVFFFTFGFVARYIFGPDSRITHIAEDNIIAAINIFGLIEQQIDLFVTALSTVFIGIIVIVLLLSIIGLVSGKSPRARTIGRLISSFVKYIGAIIIVFSVLVVWGVNAATLLASLGVLGLIIGLGAQSLISDIIAGLFIVFENCFQVGDIVTIDGFRGTVIDVGLRTTQVKDIGGDVMIIRNSELKKFVNMSQHSSFAVCDVNIEYGENLEKVEKLIDKSIPVIASTLNTIIEGPFYKGVAGFTDRGTLLRIVARCDEIDRVQLVRDLQREIRIIFDNNNIKIAVPRVRFEEGKAPVKAKR